jgi:hypothetical protein
MRATRTNQIKNIPIRIDSSLDKYEDMPLFEDKVAKATEILKRVGLPKVPIKKIKITVKITAKKRARLVE